MAERPILPANQEKAKTRQSPWQHQSFVSKQFLG
jgi:hypothetical protein